VRESENSYAEVGYSHLQTAFDWPVRRLYFQLGNGNYCWQNDATVIPCMAKEKKAQLLFTGNRQ